MEKETTSILLIDDDSLLRETHSDYFRQSGFSVLEAANGEQGLELFHHHRPDLLIVDLRMPVLDGLGVLAVISKESPITPVIVLSGQGHMADVIEALRLGAWEYLPKPLESLEILRHSVEQALEQTRLKKENISYQQELEEKVVARTKDLEVTLFALQQSESKLSSIIENFQGFIFIIDRDHRISFMNPALVKYVGREAIGESCHKVVFGLEANCPCCSEAVLFKKETVAQEILNTKDGRWYSVIHSPILDDQDHTMQWQVIMYDITDSKQAMLDLQEQEEYLRKENLRLRTSLSERYQFGDIIGKSKAMQEIYETILNASSSDAGVIIYGETGTGKELVAHAIHQNSERKEKRFVYVNCGAIPEGLIESEFFGYKKGAFTGAVADKHGFLDLAEGGTLFLDEVGDIPLSMQIKLLRSIEHGGYTPLGSSEVKKPEVRIVAATNRDLKEMVKRGQMRQDFFYRLHIIPIQLPPLRERKEDIPLLIEHFMNKIESNHPPTLTGQMHEALQRYDWPGNIRELKHTLHRFVTLGKLDFMELDLADSPAEADSAAIQLDKETPTLHAVLESVEKKLIIRIMQENRWHQGHAAETLSIDPKTLSRKLKQYGLSKPSTK